MTAIDECSACASDNCCRLLSCGVGIASMLRTVCVQAKFTSLHASMLHHLSQKRPPLDDIKARRVRDPVIKILAAYMPFYMPPDKVVDALVSLPALSYIKHDHPEVPDYLLKELSKQLRSIQSRRSLVKYLDGLEPLARSLGPSDLVSEVPKAQLQNQLYFLSLPGGPRCANFQIASANAFYCRIFNALRSQSLQK